MLLLVVGRFIDVRCCVFCCCVLLSVGNCLWSVVRCALLLCVVVCLLLFVVCCLFLFDVGRVWCSLRVACCLLFVVWCSLCVVVCWLLFVVCCGLWISGRCVLFVVCVCLMLFAGLFFVDVVFARRWCWWLVSIVVCC